MIIQLSEMDQYGSADLRCSKCDMHFFRVVNVPGTVLCPSCNEPGNTQEIRRDWEASRKTKES